MSVYYPRAAVKLLILWDDSSQKTNKDFKYTYELNITPRRATVYVNDYLTADTFDLEIDYKEFPFDPRTIRACGVQIYMENVGKLYDQINVLQKVKMTPENAVFLGFADEESIHFDDSKRLVRLEGRDFTSLFNDRQYFGPTPNLQERLDKVIQQIVDLLPENSKADPSNKIKVEIRGIPLNDLPILASFSSSKEEGSGQKNVRRDEKYWDVIQDIVRRAGFIAFIELGKLVITKPRALYGEDSAKLFVYGKNISNLQFKRKIGRKKNFNLVVRSYSLEKKQVIEAQIPKEATKVWSEETGIPIGEVFIPQINPNGQADQEQKKVAPYIGILVPDITEKSFLVRIGEETYEELSRQQIEGSFSTREMETTTKDGTQFDILKLRNGTPIQITVDQGDLEGIHNMQSLNQRIKYLEMRGYSSQVASVFASTLDKFKKVFYTRSVRFTVDESKGFSADVEFINFIDTKLPASRK